MDTHTLKLLSNTIRTLAIDAVEKAKSGHPGLPMGVADIGAVLFANYLRFNPKEPNWEGRDRFILSAGHGSMLLYALLHLFGYDLSLDELKNFRQWESLTPGHPEFGLTPGVETTTGPLGQGFANGVGIALSAKLLQQRYSSELFEFRVFGIVSDGDLMEGVTAEAASIAGHLALGNIKYIYDDNDISIGGSTDVCFTESVEKRFEAYNWYVQKVDGHDVAAVSKALDNAILESKRPSLIIAKTTIGFGSPNKAGSHEVHGAPLGPEEVRLTKKALGWPEDASFLVPKEITGFCSACLDSKREGYDHWVSKFNHWQNENGELSKKLQAQLNREISPALKGELMKIFSEPKKDATRNLSGKVIQVIAKHLPFFIGGSADLEPSTKTLITDSKDIGPNQFAHKNIRFGVREHAMGAIVNGLAYTKAWIPYGSTFLVFSDYMRASIRLAAISKLQSIFIFTHDSFWVGEDGPTHQPIEHTESLRLIPNLYLFRPADGVEVALCYLKALELKHSPSALLLSRQDVPPLEREKFQPDMVLRGGYIVSGHDAKDIVIVATGSEVWVALEAAKLLRAKGKSVRVVSLPCVELFSEQDVAFREGIIPPNAKKISLEAGVTSGWHRIVGNDGLKLGIDSYGASAPGAVLSKKFGFMPDQVAEKVLAFL